MINHLTNHWPTIWPTMQQQSTNHHDSSYLLIIPLSWQLLFPASAVSSSSSGRGSLGPSLKSTRRKLWDTGPLWWVTGRRVTRNRLGEPIQRIMHRLAIRQTGSQVNLKWWRLLLVRDFRHTNTVPYYPLLLPIIGLPGYTRLYQAIPLRESVRILCTACRTNNGEHLKFDPWTQVYTINSGNIETQHRYTPILRWCPT